VSRLKTVFFSPRFARCMFFLWFTRCKLPHETEIALPGLPHEQICSTWASPRTELLYLGFPTNRSCLPELPHEQNYSTGVSPRTELQVANLFLEVILFVGKPRESNSVLGEAWGGVLNLILLFFCSRILHFAELGVGRDLIGFNIFASPNQKLY
jgi:hypothetical protein